MRSDHTDRYAHISPAFRHVAAWPAEDRVRFMEMPRWLGYPKATTLLSRLDRMLDMPKRPRMPNRLLVGDANNGKTTLIRRFASEHPPFVNDDGESVKDVIVAEAPPTADEKGLYVSILERSAAPYRATLPISHLRYQVIHVMRQCHTRMLVIDEFHSLLTGPVTRQGGVMNAIKFLCNELAIPIVGVGTEDAIGALYHDSQHASRFEVERLPLWSLNSDFSHLLNSFELVLPLRKPSRIGHPDLANRIHPICGGNIGDLHQLLIQCATDAIRSGTEQITEDIVKENSWLRPTDGIRERPP